MKRPDATREEQNDRLIIWLIALAMLVLACVQSRVGNAQELHDHSTMGVAGQFIAKWKIPNAGSERMSSCCSQKDCYATAIKNVGGTWFGRHRETGSWIVIPDHILEELQPDEEVSPDGQSYMCANPEKRVFCAVRGDGT